MRRVFLLTLLCTFASARIFCQAGPAAQKDELLALDIAVSSYYELVDLAKKYGLSTDGDSAALLKRIYAHLGLSSPIRENGGTAITIESASSLQYLTLDVSGDSAIKLTGPLKFKAVTSDGFVHSISADSLLYNKTRNLIEAEGNVVYSREGNGKSDTFKGSSLLVDLNDYNGVFLDGSFNLEPTGQLSRTLIFHFDTLIRRSEDLMVLGKTSLTACDADPPHYHIDAAKVWLFGNGDWALSNATLYLGGVPILWLPYFYFPTGEPVFHPVFGYKLREGAFVQTTTYLLGQMNSGASTSSGLSVFQSGSSNKGELSGLFIRRTSAGSAGADSKNSSAAGAKAGSSASTPATLKLLADIYTSLGALVGLVGNFPDSKGGSLSFSVNLAASRSIFLESNGYYSPFDAANAYQSVWNTTNIFGQELPFRFMITSSWKGSVKGAASSLSYDVNVPLYSDPFFEQDFTNRNESSSLLGMTNSQTTTISERTSYTQNAGLTFTWSPGSSAAGGGILDTLRVSKLKAQMSWLSKSEPTSGLSADQYTLLSVDPRRDFFYPDILRPIDLALSASGTFWSNNRKVPSVSTANQSDKKPDYSLGGNQGLLFSVGWLASGSAYQENKFYSLNWIHPRDIDMGLSYSLVSWKGSAGLSSKIGIGGNLLSVSSSTLFSAQDQTRTYLYDDRTSPTTVNPLLLSDYMYRTSSLQTTLTATMMPFAQSGLWAASNISYSLSAYWYQLAYYGLSGGGVNAKPIYSTTWIGWDTNSITTNSIAAALVLSPGSFRHSLTLAANIPPQLEKYSLGYAMEAPWIRASTQAVLAQTAVGTSVVPSSLSASVNLGKDPFPTVSSDFSWDFTNDLPLSSSTTLKYGSLSARFTAQESSGYTFSSGSWVADGVQLFRPYECSLSFNPKLSLGGGGSGASADARSPSAASSLKTQGSPSSFKFNAAAKLSLTQNLLRFTESTLSAGFDFSLSNQSGFSLSFSSVSANSSAWRYYPSIFPTTKTLNPNDYYKNIFSDIFQSLSIWDYASLSSTLIKLQSLSLKMAADLHDWNLSATLGMSPYLVTPSSGRAYYQMDFSFSIAVTWKDIPDLKKTVQYESNAFVQ